MNERTELLGDSKKKRGGVRFAWSFVVTVSLFVREPGERDSLGILYPFSYRVSIPLGVACFVSQFSWLMPSNRHDFR